MQCGRQRGKNAVVKGVHKKVVKLSGYKSNLSIRLHGERIILWKSRMTVILLSRLNCGRRFIWQKFADSWKPTLDTTYGRTDGRDTASQFSFAAELRGGGKGQKRGGLLAWQAKTIRRTNAMKAELDVRCEIAHPPLSNGAKKSTNLITICSHVSRIKARFLTQKISYNLTWRVHIPQHASSFSQ